MSDLSDAFSANLEELADVKKEFLYTCSARDYTEYSKSCGFLDGLAAAQVAFNEAEVATS